MDIIHQLYTIKPNFMKFKILCICILLTNLLSAQSRIHCGNEIMYDRYHSKYSPIENAYKSLTSEFKNSALPRGGGVLKIPVVFHVLWHLQKPEENLSDKILERQIEILNDAFRARNSDIGQLRSIFQMTPEDSEIEFYIATKNTAGQAQKGIIHKQVTRKFVMDLFGSGINIDMKSSLTGGDNPWDVTKYLNIWTVDMPIEFFGMQSIGIIGFGTPPMNLPNWPQNSLDGIGADGIVMQYQFIGDNNPAAENLPSEFDPFKQGKSLVHECGHYLGLRHIWADKGDEITGAPACENSNGVLEDDGIDDTPYCGSSSIDDGCDPEKNSCEFEFPVDFPDMWENYMDYSNDACQVLFTPKQVEFMRMVIMNHRSELVTWDVVATEDSNPEKISIDHNRMDRTIRFQFPQQLQQESLKYSLHDACGNLVFDDQRQISSTEGIIQLPQILSGIYFFSLSVSKHQITKKIIVQ